MRISTATLRETGIINMMSRQVEMNDTQEKIASGLQLLKPSDDPAAMARVLDYKASIAANTQYQKNISAIELRLNNEDTALDSASNILNRVRELTLTGLNASYNGSDREAIGREIHEMTQALMDIANTKNHSGDYIFSGSKSDTKPFDFDSSSTVPTVVYQGDRYQTRIQIGPGIFMAASHSGFSIFENIPTSDPAVNTVKPTSTTETDALPPTDTAVTEGEPVDPLAPVTEGVDSGDGVTETDTTVSETVTTTTTTGTEKATRSIFNTLLKLENAFTGNLPLEEVNQIANYALQDLDASLNSLSDARVDVGARLNTLDHQGSLLEKFILDSRQNLSDVQDADYAEVISRFNLHQTALQASQQAYTKVQGLSLFNYL